MRIEVCWSPESFRGASPEKIDPNANPVDTFINLMQKASSGNPMEIIGMLQGLVRNIAGAPGVPLFVRESGAHFADDLQLWTEGKSPQQKTEAPAATQTAASETSAPVATVNGPGAGASDPATALDGEAKA